MALHRNVVSVVTCAALFICAALAACGTAKPPPPPPRVEYDAAPPPIVDAAPPEIPEAAPPEDAAAKAKPYALCSVGGDPRAVAQCLAWRGCGNGMDQTYGAKRIRHCNVSPEACTVAERQVADLVDTLRDRLAPDGGSRVCTNRNYLKKEIRIDEGRITICPDDKDDAALSALWKRLVATCKEPIHE